MSGITPLLDTLLATRLAQRVDLVPLKAALEIAGPEAVNQVEKVVNDVRLPSRDALERQLGTLALRDHGDAGLASSSGKPGGPVTWSAAARALSAILNLPAGDSSAVRGAAPLWPDRQPPAVSLLAANLARAVAGSGLFYESHLQQYVAGARTLAQLAQEPQAGLPAAGKMTQAADPAAGAGGGARLVDPALTTPAVTAPLSAAALAPSDADAASPVPAQPGRVAASLGGSPQAGAAPAPAPQSAGAAVRAEAVDLAAAYGRNAAPDNMRLPFHDIAGQEPGAESPTASLPDALRASHPVTAIHPEAMALVRQQLDLLAVPVFRWTGEGWPGVPMDWDIREDAEGQEERGAEGGVADSAATWTTHLTLHLPRLGTVTMRLSFADTTLQLHLAAAEPATVARLRENCTGLPQRFGALGLQLTDVQVGAAGKTGVAGDPMEAGDAA